MVCDGLGDYTEARRCFLEVLVGWPGEILSAFILFDSALDHKDKKTAVDMLEFVREHDGASQSWASMAFKYALVYDGLDAAFRLLRRACHDFPGTIGPRLVLMRHLLQEERVAEADPFMRELEALGVAEAAYGLGIKAYREGHAEEALSWMQRALELNPGHEETQQQIQALERALGKS